MISVRRHALTIVAIFLALAIGLVLGVTSSGQSTSDSEAADETTVARLEGIADSLALAVTDERLEDRPVLFVQTPGASEEDVDAVAQAVGAAGGLDAGRILLTEKAFAPDDEEELSSVIDGLPLGGAATPEGADPGMRLGLALSRAAMLDPATSETYLSDDERGDVMTSLADAEFVSYEEGTLRAGGLAVVVAGSDGGVHGTAGERTASLARQLESDSDGVVVASRSGGSAADGAVSELRGLGDTGVTTVDNVASAPGRLAVVLGLAEQLDDGSGAYGLRSNADAAVPTVPAP